jgi:hypothetical protein
MATTHDSTIINASKHTSVSKRENADEKGTKNGSNKSALLSAKINLLSVE